MPIASVVLKVTDIDRSVDFHTTFLDARTVGEVRSDEATLDLVSGTVTDPDGFRFAVQSGQAG